MYLTRRTSPLAGEREPLLLENRSELKRAEPWELESRLALAYMKSAEAVKKGRSDNASVSSSSVRPSPCGKLPITSPEVLIKILNYSEYFHVAVRGRKDSQANSNVDREVDARFFARVVT
jgi:hypothetical protein